jgi:hypothetical protein
VSCFSTRSGLHNDVFSFIVTIQIKKNDTSCVKTGGVVGLIFDMIGNEKSTSENEIPSSQASSQHELTNVRHHRRDA